MGASRQKIFPELDSLKSFLFNGILIYNLESKQCYTAIRPVSSVLSLMTLIIYLKSFISRPRFFALDTYW